MLWDDHEVQDNYAGGAPGGGLPPDKRYTAAAPGAPPTRPSSRRCRTRRRAANARIYRAAAVRPHGRPHRHGPAPVPRRPAVRRRRRARLRRLRPAPRPSSAPSRWTGSRRELQPLEGRVEGHRQRGHDHADQGPRRRLLRLRQLAGLPAGARGAARPTSSDKGIKDVVFVTGDIHTFIAGDVRTADRARASRSRSSSSAARSRRRASARPTSPPAAASSSRATTPTRTPTRRSSRRCAASTRGSTRPTSTTTATGGSRRRAARSTSSSCASRRSSSAPRRRCRPPGSGGRCSAGRRRWWPRRAPSCARARAGRARRAQAALMEVSRRLQRCSR